MLDHQNNLGEEALGLENQNPAMMTIVTTIAMRPKCFKTSAKPHSFWFIYFLFLCNIIVISI